MTNKIANSGLSYIKNCNYGFKEPLAYVALIPVISIVVKLIKFKNYEQQFDKAKDIPERGKITNKFEKLCKAHFQGAFIQVIALHILFPGIGSLVALTSLIDAAHTFYEVFKLRDDTVIVDYNEHGKMRSFETHSATPIGW